MKKRTKTNPCRIALRAARALLDDWLETEITSHSQPEKKARPGSIKEVGYYFHPNTINDVHAARSVRAHKRALRLIDAALSPDRVSDHPTDRSGK